ncbi:carboxypeptidase-like regulatory domain-containing protein [Bacillus sp. T33-2]|uniref:carboxypeptidase-like regulatory domain-containing protein n=1 Tax=Bacillus sp. T33-2 TaxID=2054168 RepID=UPI000C784F0B|nr:carboxypeptidase-like regulatory domain-containing protein [Bacillus sp. T33-2]PLR95879.1 hypothetical protein CVD19_12690 [Bacillus sp. T33-2]
MKKELSLFVSVGLASSLLMSGVVNADNTGKVNYDLDSNGVVNSADLNKLVNAVKKNQYESAFDFDQDHQLTSKDVSYFKKFALNKEGEFFLNLKHLNWLNEEVTVDGIDMMITRLYAEPNNPHDLSQGYHYVGDPQEGIAALDDVSRAVTAYVEHYKLYKDEYSLSQIKDGLEFVMWMQESDGDFRNFVALDENGEIYKRDSHSSSKTFSYWATRAYTSLSYAHEILKEEDPEFADRVKKHMELSSNRINEKVKPLYGTYTEKNGEKYPAWDLYDNWVTTIALDALTKHHAVLPNDTVKENIQMLGEALYASQFGDFINYPYGGFMSTYSDRVDIWSEWGSQQVAAMALAGDALGNENWIAAAELAADSFLSDSIISGRAFSQQPNDIKYPQINYGTASYVDNFIKLYDVTGKEKYAFMAGVAGQWWLGNNDKNHPMFNQEYGIAFDAIDENKVNINSGAESNIEAIRALARILQNETSKTALFSTELEKQRALTIELEDQYVKKTDELYQLNNGSLSDPDKAIVVKQSDDPALNENNEAATKEEVIPQESYDQEAEIYEEWTGQNALFVKGAGYNNTRLYDDSYLYRDIPVNGEAGSPNIGDVVSLQFATRLEFDTQLEAKVLAFNDNGESTVISQVEGMNYHYRHWYSGDSSIKTSSISPIPEGTTKLRIMFNVESENQWFNKGYVSLADVKLYKVNTPELRAGGTEFSKGRYIEMPAGQEKEITLPEEIKAGDYRVYVSARTKKEPGEIQMEFGENQTLSVDLADEEESVQIIHTGTVKIDEGQTSFQLKNSGEIPADIDQITLYPLQSKASYETLKGKTVTVIRDSISNNLIVDEEQSLKKRNIIHSSFEINDGKALVYGSITDLNGKVISNEHVTITALGQTYKIKTNHKGEYSKLIPYTDELKRAEIKSGKSIGYLYFK